MIEWLRVIPHPSYGNYGGSHKKCTGDECPAPIDSMDLAFRRHDLCLDKSENKKERQMCDDILHEALAGINPKRLKRKIYGRFYLYSCLLIF